MDIVDIVYSKYIAPPRGRLSAWLFCLFTGKCYQIHTYMSMKSSTIFFVFVTNRTAPTWLIIIIIAIAGVFKHYLKDLPMFFVQGFAMSDAFANQTGERCIAVGRPDFRNNASP